MADQQPRFPGIERVINGNGAVAYVMGHVCGGVIGYPITPSTEISELFEANRAEGNLNVFGKHPFFFEPEGEHSAQSGALGAALTGGQYISNASSSQGILYGLESHYVTVGKKVGGFVLQVAARVVSKHSLNVMAGHDDVYALLSSGYTILFGANPQEAADLAAIAYRASALSLIPVANAMDGFSTSHMLCETRLPEPELLREYLGDPAGRIPCPTVAQEILYGAKGRVAQLEAYLARHRDDVAGNDLAALRAFLDTQRDDVEADNAGVLLARTLPYLPDELHAQWRRQWINAAQRGTRQLVPALVDVHNPGLTGPVQNQPDFQAGAVDHRTHFASAVPGLVRQAMAEYSALTGRQYAPVLTYGTEDADVIMVGLGSVTDDVQAVLPYLRSQGIKAGLVAVKLLQPFPEAEVAAALAGAKAVTVLERSDHTALTTLVTQALFRAHDNSTRPDAGSPRHPGLPRVTNLPTLTTAIFGLGGHDLQPRHLIAAFQNMRQPTPAPLVYLGSQFFTDSPAPELADVQAKLRTAYPETALMALATEPNPSLLPETALRIRFHSVGGYGTIATGKLLTDILAGLLGMHSKSAPKYGSEKSGAPTNYYITLSPEPVLLTNAELEDVDVVIAPDHKAFIHTNPLAGISAGGTLILQSSLTPEQVWRDLPRHARATIRARKIHLLVIDAFAVAKRHAPTADLETRMMGIAFIGAVVGHVDRVVGGADEATALARVREQIEKKFGGKGAAVVEGNLAVIREGIEATHAVDYDQPSFVELDDYPAPRPLLTVAASAAMCPSAAAAASSNLFDPGYYEALAARPFREGTIGEAPVLPGAGLFMPPATGLGKDKGLFRLSVPEFHADTCTGCMDCALVCPDAAIPNTVHEIHDLLLAGIEGLDVPTARKTALRGQVFTLAERTRALLREDKSAGQFHAVVAQVIEQMDAESPTLRGDLGRLVDVLATFPVARTRPFFDAAEAERPGTGGLFSAVIDPWKCTGCLECVDVCGPGALTEREQTAEVTGQLQARFGFLGRTPGTPDRFTAEAITEDGDVKRLMLDRDTFYATTGGHGGCRGCGEVTAIRLLTSAGRALGERRRRAHLRALETLVDDLRAKLETVPPDDAPRRARIDGALAVLDRRLYLQEAGPTGNGPAPMVIANATGCSSVYASTMPFNNYRDPWVNSLFQDAPPLAKGIFEGLAARAVDDVRALRVAELELADAYDPAVHDAPLRVLTWDRFTPRELALLPTVLTIGGDGAEYDIGFGSLSRILASGTPIKVLVLNTGVYSNTGGQASTASPTAADSDLARFGAAHSGKREGRKELGLLAAFHPEVFACSTSTALQGHYLRGALAALTYTDGPALLDVYTPCGAEHGFAEAHSARRAKLAVESRMSPVFVHDPRRGESPHERFSLEGNPDIDKPWTTTTVEYRDEAGAVRLLETPLTPAEFALGETRFKKHFRRLPAETDTDAVPIDAYVQLGAEQAAGKVPFVYATDERQHLIKVAVGPAIVALVRERARYWQLLRYLAGRHEAEVAGQLRDQLAALRVSYEESLTARETAIDDIAATMVELATSSGAPVAGGPAVAGLGGVVGAGGPVPAEGGTPAAPPSGSPIVTLDPADAHLCNDCGTCYKELPELFEATKMVIDGEVRQVGRLIPGALEKIEVTPALLKRLARVKATCDAEIIR